jgi:hypothetical protein
MTILEQLAFTAVIALLCLLRATKPDAIPSDELADWAIR